MTLKNVYNNFVIKNLNNRLAIVMNYFYNDNNLTQLHRWCNPTSPIYEKSCNWEKKVDNALIDNCYSLGYKTKVKVLKNN